MAESEEDRRKRLAAQRLAALFPDSPNRASSIPALSPTSRTSAPRNSGGSNSIWGSIKSVLQRGVDAQPKQKRMARQAITGGIQGSVTRPTPYRDAASRMGQSRLGKLTAPVPVYRDAAARMGQERLIATGPGVSSPTNPLDNVDLNALLNAASGEGTGGGGSSGTPEPYVDENLLARVKGLGVDTTGLHDAAAEAIRGIYGDANRDMGAPFTAQMAQYQEGANRMGTGQQVSNDENLQLFDAAGRQLQETSDQNLASHLATVEKLKGLRAETFAGLENAIANGWNPYNTGGGSGDGDSSSGDDSSLDLQKTLTDLFQTQAVEDQVYRNPGVADAIAQLPNDQLRAAVDQYYMQAGGDPTKALSTASRERARADQVVRSVTPAQMQNLQRFIQGININPFRPGPQRNLQSASKKKVNQVNAAQKARDEAQQVIDFFRMWSDAYGPQTTNQTVTSTGRQADNTRYRPI